MKRNLLLPSLLALSVIQLVPAQTPDHFSHVTLTIPAGWTRSETGGWVLFTPPGLGPDETVWIGVSPGGPSNRDFVEEFGAFVKVSANGMTTVNSGKLQMGSNGQGLKTIQQSAILQDANGQKHIRLYVATRNGDRFESMAFTSSDPDDAALYQVDLERFIKNMVFDGVAAPTAQPAAPNPAATARTAGPGAKYGARDPRTCSSRKAPASGSLSADQAKQYFICLCEGEGNDLLYLVSQVRIEIAKGRKFNHDTDGFLDGDLTQTVYPIAGTVTGWQCTPLGGINADPGKNCLRIFQPKASGICYKTTVGDWTCNMLDTAALSKDQDHARYPPPTEK